MFRGVSAITRAQLPVLPEPRLDLAAPDVDAAVAAAALLTDPTRAAILRLLRDGPHCVCEMAAATGQRENNLSNHLARLREAGLVRASRHEVNARFQYYERDEKSVGTLRDALRDVLG
jgi:DNA-binding transcriptional ArsR family regulator